jgi:hypothetical protein
MALQPQPLIFQLNWWALAAPADANNAAGAKMSRQSEIARHMFIFEYPRSAESHVGQKLADRSSPGNNAATRAI